MSYDWDGGYGTGAVGGSRMVEEDSTARDVHALRSIVGHLASVSPSELQPEMSGLLEVHLKLGDLILGVIRADTK